MSFDPVATQILVVLGWGLAASLAMIALTFAGQNLGWSRLDFPLLLGTLFTGERRAAILVGFVLYLLIGWLISFFYYLLFTVAGGATVLLGALVGTLHGLLLLVVFLPLLPYVHPRVASEYDAPTGERRLEPPGFLALHYGYRTPAVMIAAYGVYGAILGFGFR